MATFLSRSWVKDKSCGGGLVLLFSASLQKNSKIVRINLIDNKRTEEYNKIKRLASVLSYYYLLIY
jgi:hypothetical protein